MQAGKMMTFVALGTIIIIFYDIFDFNPSFQKKKKKISLFILTRKCCTMKRVTALNPNHFLLY